MKSFKKFLILIGVLIIGGAGWYLGSPLFIDNVVEEDFPFEEQAPVVEQQVPTAAEIAAEEKRLMEKMETLTVEEVEAMPVEDQAALQMQMQDVAKTMPDAVVEDTMPTIEVVEEIDEPAVPTTVAQGVFTGADSFHKGAGTATLFKLPDQTHLLRFTDFSVTNGPALSVFLTKADGTMTDIGKLKGNKGNQNYPIPNNIDVSEYTGVLIYCVPFKVEFASANLQ